MEKKIAVITDIHGNYEALLAIIKDIKKEKVDEIICLGDTISFGPNSKECLDLLIGNNVKMTLGNHELYLLKGIGSNSSITNEEKEHYEWIKNSLMERELSFIKKCPLYYECTIKYDSDRVLDHKITFSHYLFNDIKADYPFEHKKLNEDINLWIKHNKLANTQVIGHLHKSFDINKVEGIYGDCISETLDYVNIFVVDSAGCTEDDKTSYLLITINKATSYEKKILKYDRNKFVNKLLNTKYPNKENIMKKFFGIEI